MVPKVSIIVPVYNVEKYIDRCLNSLLQQSYGDFEVILVDDGSKDLSGKKCDEWEQKDARIKVIHKENEGLGFARNTGIKQAVGKYIAYVDSDDYLELDMLEKAVSRIENTKADVCYFGCIDIWSTHRNYGTPPQKLLYEKEEVYKYVEEILGPDASSTQFLFGGVSAWSGIVKRELLVNNNILFPSERECLCEDIFYNLAVCKNSSRIVIEPSCLYCYCHNENSLTTSYRKDRFDAALRMYTELCNIFREYQVPNRNEFNNRLERSLMQNLIVCLKQEILYEKKNGRKVRNNNLKEIYQNDTVRKILEDYPIKRMPIKQRMLFLSLKWQYLPLIVVLMKIRLKNR